VQWLHIDPALGRELAEPVVQAVYERRRRLGRCRVDQQLAEVWRRRFRVVIVVESWSAAAGERGYRLHLGLPAQFILQSTQHLVSAGEPGAGGHPEIDNELIALVQREEAIRHRRHERETRHERHHAADHR